MQLPWEEVKMSTAVLFLFNFMIRDVSADQARERVAKKKEKKLGNALALSVYTRCLCE